MLTRTFLWNTTCLGLALWGVCRCSKTILGLNGKSKTTTKMMTTEEIKEELIELQTIQIALDDKLHKFEEILSRLKARINDLANTINNSVSDTV